MSSSTSSPAFLSPLSFRTAVHHRHLNARSVLCPALPLRLRIHSANVSRRAGNDVRMQTWSDPAVTREYFDYLEGRNQREETTDCQSTIVGTGRIGSLLAKYGTDDLMIKRGEAIPSDAPGPVYVCTRNDDLDDIIASCPEEKREDLVFVQNGFLERFLRERQVAENTKANLYFAVPKLGATPIDGITATDPDGLTAVCGKWEGRQAYPSPLILSPNVGDPTLKQFYYSHFSVFCCSFPCI